MMATDEIASAFQPGNHASTFGGNPLASAAALVVLGGFLHYLEDVEYFGKRVLPIVRALEAKGARVAA